MTAHTPFLSALVLLSSAFPAQVFRLGLNSANGRSGGRASGGPATGGPATGRATGRGRTVALSLVLPLAFALVAALTWYLAPVTGVLGGLPERDSYYLAAGIGLAAPLVEIGVGVLIARFRRIPVARIALHERWTGLSVAALLGVVITAAAEELVFRGVWLAVLEQPLGWPVAAAIGLTALVYGFNHLYFGWLTVAQKVVTGVGFGVLFEVCGRNLLVPVLAHVAQNLVVLLVLPLFSRRRR